MTDYMAAAQEAAFKSDDPDTQVGAVIVRQGIVVGTGANRLVEPSLEVVADLSRPAKYKWLPHAEVDAIACAAACGSSTLGATMYLTGFPCPACANAIVRAGIRELACSPWSGHSGTDWGFDISEEILKAGRVRVNVRS